VARDWQAHAAHGGHSCASLGCACVPATRQPAHTYALLLPPPPQLNNATKSGDEEAAAKASEALEAVKAEREDVKVVAREVDQRRWAHLRQFHPYKPFPLEKLLQVGQGGVMVLLLVLVVGTVLRAIVLCVLCARCGHMQLLGMLPLPLPNTSVLLPAACCPLLAARCGVLPLPQAPGTSSAPCLDPFAQLVSTLLTCPSPSCRAHRTGAGLHPHLSTPARGAPSHQLRPHLHAAQHRRPPHKVTTPRCRCAEHQLAAAAQLQQRSSSRGQRSRRQRCAWLRAPASPSGTLR
jgi:hypothetical protein